MNAGRDLDALVAEQVFGCKIKHDTGFNFVQQKRLPTMYCQSAGHEHVNFPMYSTSISAAWEVVEKMDQRKYTWLMNPQGSTVHCSFMDNGNPVGNAQADTAPLAICLAALKAVGHTEAVQK